MSCVWVCSQEGSADFSKGYFGNDQTARRCHDSGESHTCHSLCPPACCSAGVFPQECNPSSAKGWLRAAIEIPAWILAGPRYLRVAPTDVLPFRSVGPGASRRKTSLTFGTDFLGVAGGSVEEPAKQAPHLLGVAEMSPQFAYHPARMLTASQKEQQQIWNELEVRAGDVVFQSQECCQTLEGDATQQFMQAAVSYQGVHFHTGCRESGRASG